jgi:hypothetical protein
VSIIIAKDGTEPVIGEAVAYLERRYGLPAKDIQAVNVYAKAGDPIAITVTLFMQEDDKVTVTCAECDHAVDKHWDETAANPVPVCTGDRFGRVCTCDHSRQLVVQLKGQSLGDFHAPPAMTEVPLSTGQEAFLAANNPPTITTDADRKLIGPPHAHLDAPCTDRCYEVPQP